MLHLARVGGHTISQVTDPPFEVSDGYRRYVLGMLLTIFVVSYVDRQILAILLPPIKAEMDLSDTQLGFLTGFAFAIFYAVMGIPIGQWADRWNRRNIISICLVLWSLMTAASGLALNFIHLVLARIGVGVGEAGTGPCNHSLIADYYPVESRATAMGIYSLGIPIGALLGIIAGGWINEFFGWRMAFIAVGLPGVMLAVIIQLTLKEPPRGHADGVTDIKDAPDLKEVLTFLWGSRTYVHLLLGACVTGMCYIAVTQWVPSYMSRSFGLGTGEIATLFGPAVGIAGGLGTLFSGYMVDKLRPRDLRWQAWIPGAAIFLTIPGVTLSCLASSANMAVVYLILPLFFFPMQLAPFSALVQGLVPLRMRSVAVAISLFISTVIAFGLGPQVTGIVSDLLEPRFGVDSLRYGILVVAVGGAVWSGIHFLICAQSIKADQATSAVPQEG